MRWIFEKVSNRIVLRFKSSCSGWKISIREPGSCRSDVFLTTSKKHSAITKVRTYFEQLDSQLASHASSNFHDDIFIGSVPVTPEAQGNASKVERQKLSNAKCHRQVRL